MDLFSFSAVHFSLHQTFWSHSCLELVQSRLQKVVKALDLAVESRYSEGLLEAAMYHGEMPECVYQTIIGVMDGLPQVMPPLIAEDTQCNVASQHDANHPRPYWQAHRVKSHQIKANRLVASESYHFCPRQAPFSSPQGLVLHLFSCRSPGSDAARQHNTGSIVVQAGREHEEVDFETEVEVEGLVWMPVLQADAARQCITGLIIPEVDRSATAGQEKEPLDISSNSQGAIQKDIGMEHVQSPCRKKRLMIQNYN